ncbi:MAG TPA: hypothetical protein VFS24_00990, partial [Steroidobacteraceae bacterium]|nr:hypothetical protein [Steroidobacteraceae bacterium]
IDGDTDDSAALIAALASTNEVYLPEGDILIESGDIEIVSNKRIRTAGLATRIVNTDPDQFDTPVLKVTGSNVEIGDLSFLGAIADQTGEWNHCVSIRPNGAAVENVKLGRLVGESIRGDVLAVEGTATHPVRKVRVGAVTGTNMYRNVVAFIGGEDIDVESISGSQYGYRLFDVEPNAGSQRPTNIRIRNVKGANFQIAGGNLTDGVGTVTIDDVELDNALLADNTEGYPSFPGSTGNIGAILGDFQSLTIGTLKARNFSERLVNVGTQSFKGVIVIGNVDIDDCNTTETTFKTLFNFDTNVSLELQSGVIVLQGSDRYIAKANAGSYRFRNLKISGGCVAATAANCEFEGLTIDGTGVSDALFASITSSSFRNIVTSNDSSLTFFTSCDKNTLIGCTTTAGTFNATSATFHNFIQSSINGVLYKHNSIEATTAYNPGTIAAGARAKTTITVTGAVVGDYALASFLGTPTNASDVTISAKVTASNTVTVIMQNTGAASAAFTNDTLRAVVLKKLS